MVEVFGARIRHARILRGIASGDLAGRMNWRADKQSRLESSWSSELRNEEVQHLTTVLCFPEAFFRLRLRELVREDALLFRAPKSMRKRERQYLAEFATVAAEFCAWLDGAHRLPPVRLRTAHSTDVEYAAGLARESLGFRFDEPMGYLTHAIERAGIPIVVRRYDPKEKLVGIADEDVARAETHLGFSAWTGEFSERPLIMMRAVQSWERTRWTLAHELGHVVLHREDVRQAAEDEASRFANEFLAPIGSVRRQLPKTVTLSSLREIKTQWGISLSALIRHLCDNSVITDDRRRMLHRQLYTRVNIDTGKTWGLTEPGWNERKPERPRLLTVWAERCLGTIESQAIAAISGLWPADLLASLLSEQRDAPGLEDAKPAEKSPDAEVITLNRLKRTSN
jgi:Zn-dependent peptidase ImmA (M78 family)